jgi:hypothetical protein
MRHDERPTVWELKPHMCEMCGPQLSRARNADGASGARPMSTCRVDVHRTTTRLATRDVGVEAGGSWKPGTGVSCLCRSFGINNNPYI